MPQFLFAICVHEKELFGYQIQSALLDGPLYILENDVYTNALEKTNINSFQKYKVQFGQKTYPADYNDKYIEYYSYKRMQNYLKQQNDLFVKSGYKKLILGNSVRGRSIYAVVPKNIVANKKTIIIFGRHHGDEGTANWIIEGLINYFFSNDLLASYQFLFYPMINPDGVEAKSRYNDNGRDLNRSWSKAVEHSFDEAKIINTHLQATLKLLPNNKPVIALDMHGSFEKDFIYRVKKRFISTKFYALQQEFIDMLGSFDSWQNAKFKKSNGHPKMARIVLVDHFLINALTHETPRDIKLSNAKNRGVEDLKQQGRAIMETVLKLY